VPGHAPENVTELYVNVQNDEALRQTSAEKAGLGFQLKSLYLFPSVPFNIVVDNQPQMAVV